MYVVYDDELSIEQLKKLSEKLKLQEATEALEEGIEVVTKVVKKARTRKIKEAEPVLIEVEGKVEGKVEGDAVEEIVNIVPVTKKKTTRRKKAVEFDIVDEK